MTTPPPLVSLSIISHGDAKLVNQLLETLRLQEETKRFQIILTDNLGDDLPEFDPTPWAGLQILRNQHSTGFAQNQNRAFKHAQGKYFCVLNPDVLFKEPVFETLTRRLESPTVDIIAPLATDTHGELQDSFRSLPTPLELVHRQMNRHKLKQIELGSDELIYPDWIAAIFLLMPTSIYQILGGFDERYWLYFEDTDFCTRARLKGLKIAVDTSVRINHDARRSSHTRLSYMLWHLQSAVRFFTSETYRQAKKTR